MTTSLRGLAALATLTALSHAAAADVLVAPPVHYKNRIAAAALSLGATVVSNVVLVAGMSNAGSGNLVELGLVGDLVAPSAGEWYSGQFLTIGLGLRVAGAGLAVAGFYMDGGFRWYVGTPNGYEPPNSKAAEAMMITGGFMVAAGTIWDIVDAPTSADRYNSRVLVTPIMLPTPSGVAPGVSLGGAF
jgi:hypothetical protein